ncbi:MAG TPA: metal ABC transporter ATP-binding protein [Candidatus Cloacimonadota bacterium]|nr:metal ABC transporter ATP-binding protein [Candidatus Cloacimonadota bacterium]
MIEFRDLSYSINGKTILEEINLIIPKGVFAAIIGPNGAGKSTLAKLLLGLYEIQKGEILIDSMPQKEWLKQSGFGYLPQREEYDPSFPATALDIVLMGLAWQLPLGKRFSPTHKLLAHKALEQCGIADKARAQIGTLSGGEFQRLMLARAIVSGSSYLILDEPEAGIDQPGVQGFFELLKGFHSQGITIITISHDLHTLSSYCDFMICLNRTLHCHDHTELVNAEIIHKTFGENVRLIEKSY